MPLPEDFKRHLHDLMVEVSEDLHENLAKYKREVIWKAQQTNNGAALASAYSDAALHAFRTRVEKTIEKYLEALVLWKLPLNDSIESDFLHQIALLSAAPKTFQVPPGLARAPNLQAVQSSYARELERASHALRLKAANRLREIKVSNRQPPLPDKETSREAIKQVLNQPDTGDRMSNMGVQHLALQLLQRLSLKAPMGGPPITDVTSLLPYISESEVKAALQYLRDHGLVQSFSVPTAARINAKGVDALALATEGTAVTLTTSHTRDITTNRIFVVHGHEVGPREAVARQLEKLGLEPIILQEQANRGRTIIEKVEAEGNVGFAVVLLTPDDLGAKKGEQLKPRPRQNVIAELGYFIGRLGRDRVCTLASDNTLELPTDFAGVVWITFDNHGAWKSELSKELIAAGYSIDPAKGL